MANIQENEDLRVYARTVSLPRWMWEIIEAEGKRSKFIKERLMEFEEIAEGEPYVE